MKTYTLVINIIDGDTFEDMQDFVYSEFSLVDTLDLITQNGNNCRCELTAKDNFNYATFEDIMDYNSYPVEFLELN